MNYPKYKAFFFDRDGIVNVLLKGDYVKNYKEFEFTPQIFKILEIIKNNNFLAIIITNQQGIGKGLMTENDLAKIHKQMQKDLKKSIGTEFDDIFYCGCLHSKNCNRRKPNPGMITDAITKWNIDSNKSFMIGDSLSDIEAGKKAGLKTILIGNYKNSEADYVFENLDEFLEKINIFV